MIIFLEGQSDTKNKKVNSIFYKILYTIKYSLIFYNGFNALSISFRFVRIFLVCRYLSFIRYV